MDRKIPLAGATQAGMFPRLLAFLFGARAQRLTEQRSRSHWLSYLLIIAQSIAVVLVFGHVEVGFLVSTSVIVRALAVGSLTLLVITVLAADLALLETMTRVGPLQRNRQSVLLFEHLAYIFFVLAVEGATMGVVLYTLDSNPQAFALNTPFLPSTGWLFLALVVMRVVMISWSAIQLILVRAPLPVLLSTLMTTGKQIVGAHVERQLAGLDISGLAVRDTFGVYAEMAKPPRPAGGLWNTILLGAPLRWAMAREREEERQAANVQGALERLDMHRASAATAPASMARPVAPALNPSVEQRIGIAAHPTAQLPGRTDDDEGVYDGDPDDDGPGGGVPATYDPWGTAEFPAVALSANGHSRHNPSGWSAGQAGALDESSEDGESEDVRTGRKRPAMTRVEREAYSVGKEAMRLQHVRAMLQDTPDLKPRGARTRLRKLGLGTNDEEAGRLLRVARGEEAPRWERVAAKAHDQNRFRARAVGESN